MESRRDFAYNFSAAASSVELEIYEDPMAIATKRPMTAKTGMPKTGINTSVGKNSRRGAVKSTIRADGDVPRNGEMADAVATDKIIATLDNAHQQDHPNDPAAQLVGMQMRTLADLCAALDKKCLELVEEVAAARAAASVSEPAIATLNQTLAEERGLRAKLERELADTRRVHERELGDARQEKPALEREIAAMRLVLERSNRPRAMSRDSAAVSAPIAAPIAASIAANQVPPDATLARANGEHAARLLPLLQASLASGDMTAVHDADRALARFRAAATIDSIAGTREAPICLGWVLSRSDLQAEPLMFLMDDVGLLGWTDASLDRPDVSNAYRNTKPRPGFEAALSRMPVGRLRGVVAVHEAGSEGAVFFEAARKVISKSLLS